MLAVLLVALIALAVVAGVAWPLLQERRDAGSGTLDVAAPSSDLQDALDRELQAIREIAFDHRAGNLSDADFAALDAAARASAAELIRRRDDAEGQKTPEPG